MIPVEESGILVVWMYSLLILSLLLQETGSQSVVEPVDHYKAVQSVQLLVIDIERVPNRSCNDPVYA